MKRNFKPKSCPWCNDVFTPTSKRKIYCSTKCSTNYSSWLNRTKKKFGIVESRKTPSEKQFLEIEAFLYEMKSKAYYADTLDLFKLVHYYDIVFPHLENIPQPSHPEQSSNTMFKKIASWYFAKKNKI